MTVFLWPEEGDRLCTLVSSGQPAGSRTAVLYLDAAATQLAAIRVYNGTGTPGALIANSQITLDQYGMQPYYWGPDFPTGTQPQLYIVVNSTGPAVALAPQGNPRLTALEASGGGGGLPASATVVTETSYGQLSAAGVAATASRGDHTHGTPASPAVPAPATTVQAGTSYGVAGAVGTGTTYAREDHQHGTVALTAAAPTTSAVGDAAAVGSAVLPAKADHLHGREAFGAVTAQTTYGLGSANGSAATEARADHTHGTPSLSAVAATASAVGDAAAVGVGTVPARSDHAHGREAFAAPTSQLGYGGSAVTGSATTVPHSDHQHGTPSLTAVTPTVSAVGDAATVGTGTAPAREDHKHGREAFGTATGPPAYGAANAAGSALTLSHSDHIHGMPALPTAAQVGAVALATVTAKGDIYAATASGAVTNFPAGSNGNVLIADSTQSAGVRWGSGGAGTYSLPDGIDPPATFPHAVPNGPIGSNLTTVQNRGYFVPVPMGGTTRTLTEVSLEVASAGAAGTVFRLVLWSATGRVPNVSLADLGTVAGDTTGVKALTVSQVLTTGTLYFIVAIEQVATGAALRAISSYNPYVTLLASSLSGSSGFAAYVMSGLTTTVTNGTAFSFFDVDFAPRLGLKFS
jgi:hypothetical protein